MLLFAYVFLTAGLLHKYRRLALSLLGSAAVALLVATAVAVIWFNYIIAVLTEELSFYLITSIIVIAILIALWFQFDPAFVRRRDFEKEDLDVD